jgi:hypothetical protein
MYSSALRRASNHRSPPNLVNYRLHYMQASHARRTDRRCIFTHRFIILPSASRPTQHIPLHRNVAPTHSFNCSPTHHQMIPRRISNPGDSLPQVAPNPKIETEPSGGRVWRIVSQSASVHHGPNKLVNMRKVGTEKKKKKQC